MKKKSSLAEAHLSVILGNNTDKIKAIFYLNDEQVLSILKDLFSRPNQLEFSDCVEFNKKYPRLVFPCLEKW